MFTRWIALTLALLTSSLFPTALTLAPIEAVGSKLYDSETGDQFYIRGVVYRVYDDLDPLSVPAQCDLDAPLMKTLGVNTIRVYQVDDTRSHDECMSTFADAGIYVMIGLSRSGTYIEGTDPEWTMEMYSNYTKNLDAFAKYDNLLAVAVEYSVITDYSSTIAAPYIKAAIRDVKAYRDGQGYRKIPVGYADSEDNDARRSTQNYLVCGGTIADNADFFSLNRFTWCGNSSFSSSGYSTLYDDAQDYPVPIFFSETGCEEEGDRDFDEQQAVLGNEMNDRYSGDIVYEWRERSNSYGVISYQFGTRDLSWTAEGTPAGSSPTPLSPDFYNLQSQWDTLTPTGTPSSLYTPVYTSVACPQSAPSGWAVAPTATIPTIANLVITTKPAASASIAADSSGNRQSTPTTAPTAVNSGSSGLSTGAKIAIGVVIPFVALTLAITSFLLWRRRRKAKATKTKAAPDEKGPEYSEITQEQTSPAVGVSEFYNDKHGSETEGDLYNKHQSEIAGNPISQLHAEDSRQELGGEMTYKIGDPGRELAELDSYSPPLELSIGQSVKRASRDGRASMGSGDAGERRGSGFSRS